MYTILELNLSASKYFSKFWFILAMAIGLSAKIQGTYAKGMNDLF